MKLTIHKDIERIPYYPKAMMYGADEGWVRLSSNENPNLPSPHVIERLVDTTLFTNRYPGGEYELKAALSKKYGTAVGNIIIGNGSNELIEMSLKALKDDTRNEVIISDPSFAFYHIASMVYGYQVRRAPLAGMKVLLQDILDIVDRKTRIIFLNNPNNPTGTIFSENDFRAFLKKLPGEILVVVDEAYAEFVDSKDFPKSALFINDYPVVVMRTFSKAYGLAGLRIGYGIGNEHLMSFFERTKQPFSVNVMALEAAKAALADNNYLRTVLANNRKGKKFLYKELKGLALGYVETEANFILVRIGTDAEALTHRLFDERIIIRWMGAYGLPEYIRVTIGTPAENEQFIDALRRNLH